MAPRPFILASASPRRLDLLKSIGAEPREIFASDVDESVLKTELAPDYVKRVSLTKLQAAMQKFPETIILAADTAVACGRRILPKAETETQARECLKLLSGRRHRVYTGIAVCNTDGKIRQKCVMTQVSFTRLRDVDIDWYIGTNEWQGKAGSYAIQGAAAIFIPWINGSYSNVVGLPQAEAFQLLNTSDSK